ncbi:MAG: galactitol system component [Thermoanaerobacter sp.]|nr:galactitol system component [Thermoanaerobacter sp.]
MFTTIMKTFGAAVLLPIIILIFELILRVKPTKALRSALYIGIGLNGLVSILNPYFMGLIGKAVSDMINSTGVHLQYVDTGWALLAAVGYSTTIGALVIPIGILINIIMLLLHWTDTLDLDLWNFWHWAFIGSLAYYATNSLLYGILTTIAVEMFLLIIADITAPTMQKFFNLPGLAFPHASGQGITLIAVPLKWFFDKIGLTKIQVSSKTIRKRFGILGDAVVIGFIISFVIGIIAWKNKLGSMDTWAGILSLGIGTGAFIYLYPKATAALLEGFATLSDKVREILSKRGVNRQLNFGMDSALTIGHPDVLTTGLLTMLTTVPLIFFLPGNRFIMLADLGVTPFFLASAATAIMGGNIIASYITDVIGVTITLYTSSAVAPLFAKTVKTIGIALPNTGSAVVGADMRPVHGLFYLLGKSPIGLVIAFTGIFIMLFFFKRNPQAWHKAFGYTEDNSKQLNKNN